MEASTPCRPGAWDGSVLVDYVIDGDTVITDDGVHLRLIGIDTPEMGRDGHPAEAGAEQARDFLRELVPHRQRLHFLRGAEGHDRHGRDLVHLFLDDGANVQERILEAGLAAPLPIPPNLRFVECYAAAAGAAASAKRGIWALEAYAPTDAAALDPGARGYRQVSGRVRRVRVSAGSLWLDLGPGFAVRIARDDLRYFDRIDPRQLMDRIVRVRGRVYRHGGQSRMRIRHPTELMVQETGTPPATAGSN